MKTHNFIILGVSGAGKSSIAKNLSLHSNLKYVDADKFHTVKNKKKMRMGVELTEKDRIPWLRKISKFLKYKEKNWVLACSTLKQKHRNILLEYFGNITLIWLDSSFNNIVTRVNKRRNHFFSSNLIQSQFDSFEAPELCFRIETNKPLHIVKLRTRNFVRLKLKSFNLLS